MFSRHIAASAVIVLSISGALVGTAAADGPRKHGWDNDDRSPRGRDAKALQARPWIFVGTVANCGVNGSRIVTAGWLGGMGLPDNGGMNSPATTAQQDPHLGLLLNKNGATTDCAASGATIEGFKPGPISELGFDFRVGGHCGAGAPRFNVVSTAGFTYFVGGCASGTQTPAPQDPEWIRVRITSSALFFAADGGPPFVVGTTPVRSIDIVFDEGTDTNSPSDPTGVGLVVLDNIDINGKLITAGRGVVPKVDGRLRYGREDGDDN
jgi:hypothetical protein